MTIAFGNIEVLLALVSGFSGMVLPDTVFTREEERRNKGLRKLGGYTYWGTVLWEKHSFEAEG